MTSVDEDRLYGPRPELIGRVSLKQHDVARSSYQDTSDAVPLGDGPGILVQGRRDRLKSRRALGERQVGADRLREVCAEPPELLHRQVGSTHVFVGHGALAIVRGKRVWAVTSAGVEVLR